MPTINATNPTNRQAKSLLNLRALRARIAAAQAESDATYQQMKSRGMNNRDWQGKKPDGTFATPEDVELKRLHEANGDVLRTLSGKLGAAIERTLTRDPAYDRDIREFYAVPPVRWVGQPRRSLTRNYMTTGRTVMIDGERVPLVEFV
jgi:hypothetical protein